MERKWSNSYYCIDTKYPLKSEIIFIDLFKVYCSN